jgi:hypothetical protein
MKPALFAWLFAVAALPLPGFSQQPRSYDFQVNAGAIGQEGQLGVRASVGATVSTEVTKRLPYRFSVGPSLSIAAFPPPEPSIPSPGGCLGMQPCKQPSASVVWVATLGVIGLYTLPTPNYYEAAPVLLVGAGMRHLTESPERDSDDRPYGDLGLGLKMAGRFVLRVEYQATPPGSELPKWALPVTLGIAF